MKRFMRYWASPVLVLIAVWGCSDDANQTPNEPGSLVTTENTCIGCHSSEDALKTALGPAKASEVTPPALSDG